MRHILIGWGLALVALVVCAVFALLVSAADAAEEPVRLEVAYATKGDTADWQTLLVPGTTIELTARIVNGINSGFTSQGLPSLYATVATDPDEADMTFSEITHGTFYWGPKGHNMFKGSYARTSNEFECDKRGGKVVFFLPATQPEPEFNIPDDWEWPEDLPDLPFPETTGNPPGSTPPEIEDGDYLVLHWRGEMTDGDNGTPVPFVDPDYPVVWEPVTSPPVGFSLVLYQWELQGIERSSGLTTGTDQPSTPLTTASRAEAKVFSRALARLELPRAGEVTLGLLSGKVSQIQSGYWPRIEVGADSRRPFTALLSYKEGKWVWS